MRVGQGTIIGFNALRSHRIVDMRERYVLRPELFVLVEALRETLEPLLAPRRMSEMHFALVDQGVDLVLKDIELNGLQALERLTSFASSQRLARLSTDRGLGPETLYEPEP